jgi:hypothetical protein
MATYEIPSADLRRFVDPLDGSMWRCGPITEEEIESAKEAGLVEERCWNDVKDSMRDMEKARAFHIARIATLLDEVGQGNLVLVLENHTVDIKCHIYDGNHRVAAAFVRRDPKIRIFIAASDAENILAVFPNAVCVE